MPVAVDEDDRLSLGLAALVIATLSALCWADVIAIVSALLDVI